ncbi:MAG TPA: DUF1616 domain-containing protein [Gaiellaceae bacterium]|jgi:uncharacterized membrane protein
MRARPQRLDLLAAAALAAVAAATAFAPSLATPLRALLAFPLVLYLPGYAFTAAAPLPPETGRAERFAFAVGASIAVAVLAGLALNYAPGGLDRRSWAVALAAVTVGLAAVAAIRRALAVPEPAPWRPGLPTGNQVLLGAIAVLLAAAAVGISRLGALQTARETTFTQLWMLPATSASATLRIGLANHEQAAQRYRLVVRSGGRVLRIWPAVRVEPGGRWDARLALPAGLSRRVPVEAELFRPGTPRKPYRSVTFWPGSAAAGR